MNHSSASIQRLLQSRTAVRAMFRPFVFLFTVCLCASVCANCAGQGLKLPEAARVTLANGVRIVLMEYHRAPTVNVLAVFPGGVSAEPASKAGVAELTADLLTKGTEKRSAEQIAEEVDFLGAQLGAGVSADRLTMSLNVLSRDVDSGLDLMADALRRPTFPVAELERQRQLALAGLQALPDDPGSIASRVATQTAFAGHPYGLVPRLSTIKAISELDVRDYYRHVAAPERMILVAVGDFKALAMAEKLRARFESWPKTGIALPIVPRQSPAARVQILVDKPDATQTQVRWVRMGIPRSSPDYFAAELASAILGGGFTSRLVDEIRVNRSLTYGISSSFRMQKLGGSFGVSTFTKTQTTGALLGAVRSVLAKAVATGLTPAEIAKAKGYLAGQFAISMQTPEALAAELADMAFFGLPNDYLATYLARMKAVSPAQINRVARTYFGPAGMSVVLVGPASKIAGQLKPFGAFASRKAISTVE